MRKTLKLSALAGLTASVAASLGLSVAFGQAKPEIITDKIEIPNTVVKFDLVKLPGGKVTVGGKEVEVKPFAIGKHEVTWDEYDVYWQRLDLTAEQVKAGFDAENRPSKPYAPPDRGYGHNGFPAGSMTFLEAQKYVKWLSKKTGHKYRLPTEAEWVYAAKAGGDGKADKDALEKVAYFSDNGEDKTHKVGSKEPNAFGLYDTLGNVAEWVIQPSGEGAVIGGSFQDDAADVTVESKAEYTPAWQRDDPQDPKGKSWLSNGAHIGIRLVRED
jgi:formylglycine-generating enzyme required for sulfatase activity